MPSLVKPPRAEVPTWPISEMTISSLEPPRLEKSFMNVRLVWTSKRRVPAGFMCLPEPRQRGGARQGGYGAASLYRFGA